MTLSQALGLGLLQGITEFLPVSSSGHLVLARNLLPDLERPELLFDVVVHLGTLTAIVVVLRRRIGALLLGAVRYPRGRGSHDSTDLRWIGLILLASAATGAIGLALRDVVEGMHTRPAWVGGALLVTAGILYAADGIRTRSRDASELGWIDAVLVGTVQGLSVLPGVSRSGATVAAALSRGTRADVAVEFSMLVSIPAVLGASVLEGARAGLAELSGSAGPLTVGFLSALVAGALSLRAFQWVVAHHRLRPFAAYCVVVGIGAVSLA